MVMVASEHQLEVEQTMQQKWTYLAGCSPLLLAKEAARNCWGRVRMYEAKPHSRIHVNAPKCSLHQHTQLEACIDRTESRRRTADEHILKGFRPFCWLRNPAASTVLQGTTEIKYSNWCVMGGGGGSLFFHCSTMLKRSRQKCGDLHKSHFQCEQQHMHSCAHNKEEHLCSSGSCGHVRPVPAQHKPPYCHEHGTFSTKHQLQLQWLLSAACTAVVLPLVLSWPGALCGLAVDTPVALAPFSRLQLVRVALPAGIRSVSSGWTLPPWLC